MKSGGDEHPSDAARPVFVGGTGRSGTTIAGALIASHPSYAGVPFEVRVHLMIGQMARDSRPPEWFRESALGRHKTHLHRMIDVREFEALIDKYVAAEHSEAPPDVPAREFIDRLMGPIAEQQGAPHWVEMTPANAMWGSWLQSFYPDMGIVHMIRDGRDVAVSVSQIWKVMDPFEALDWWQNRIEQIAADFTRLPSQSAHTVFFESLVTDDRENEYRKLLEFLRVEDVPSMREFFDDKVNSGKANIERWKRGLDPEEQRKLSEQYAGSLQALREKGIDWAERLEAYNSEIDQQPFGDGGDPFERDKDEREGPVCGEVEFTDTVPQVFGPGGGATSTS